MKINIKNIDINYDDIILMENFIESYENSQKACDEYNDICREIRAKYNISKGTSIINELNKKIDRNLIEKLNTKDPKKHEELEKIHEDLVKNYNKLSQFKKIVEINRNYDEKAIIEYEKKEQSQQENNELFYKFKTQKSGIRIMYANIKYLYQVYEIISRYNQGKQNIIEKIKLKKALKKIKPIKLDNEYNFANIENLEQNIELFNSCREIIKQFNGYEGQKINIAINETRQEPSKIKIDENITIIAKKTTAEKKETQKEPSEIRIDENITIITNPQGKKTIEVEEPSYTKTRSA